MAENISWMASAFTLNKIGSDVVLTFMCEDDLVAAHLHETMCQRAASDEGLSIRLVGGVQTKAGQA